MNNFATLPERLARTPLDGEAAAAVARMVEALRKQPLSSSERFDAVMVWAHHQADQLCHDHPDWPAENVLEWMLWLASHVEVQLAAENPQGHAPGRC